MKRYAARSLMIALLFTVFALQPAAQVHWTEHQHSEGRLSVSLPCAPAWKTGETPRAGTAAAFTSHIAMCRADDEIYLVGWVDYEVTFNPAPEAELAENRDNFVKGLPGAQLLTSTSVTYQGLRGLDFTARLGERHITSRVLIKGRRPYQLAVISPLNADRSRNINRFMSSFRVLPD